MQKKFLIVTAAIGEKGEIKDPEHVWDCADYIAYTNKETNSKIWQLRNPISFSTIDKWKDRRNAKIYKVLSTILFPNYEYIIWHDADSEVIKNPEEIIKGKEHIELFLNRHPRRDCIYKEFDRVKEVKLDCEHLLSQHKEFYLKEKIPAQQGLTEMKAFIRRNTPNVTKLELMWWEQICKYSSRDQCSFFFCLEKMKKDNLQYVIFPKVGRRLPTDWIFTHPPARR